MRREKQPDPERHQTGAPQDPRHRAGATHARPLARGQARGHARQRGAVVLIGLAPDHVQPHGGNHDGPHKGVVEPEGADQA